MEIKFGGDFTVPKKPEAVYDFLVDPNRFCPLLPDYQSMEIRRSPNFLVKLSVGISHIRGTAAVKMSLVETERPPFPEYAKYPRSTSPENSSRRGSPCSDSPEARDKTDSDPPENRRRPLVFSAP